LAGPTDRLIAASKTTSIQNLILQSNYENIIEYATHASKNCSLNRILHIHIIYPLFHDNYGNDMLLNYLQICIKQPFELYNTQ